MKEILLYKMPSGKSTIDDFLDSLSSKEAKKVVWVMKLVEELENISTKYYKQLSNCDGIIEVRARIGKNHFRLLGFEYQGTFIVLTNGFKKKDQKVPNSEIDLAQQRRKDYVSRKDKHE